MNQKEYAKIIAKNLRRIAYDAGKSQADISRDLKINKATISSWMNGTRVPRMENVDLLCHYFNVSRTEIMEEPDQVQNNGQQTWYLDDATAEAAQALYDRPDLRALLDAAHDSSPETIKQVTALLLSFKETNPDG